MALVDYSSSDEGDSEVQISSKPAPSALPPLPSKFHDLYASTVRVSTQDDPSLHGGRTRATPHVQGNWPTHLYIEWYPSKTEHASLSAVISALQDQVSPADGKLNSLLTSDLAAPLPLHISLSQPISFATDRKYGFAASLERTIRSSGIRPFDVDILSMNWVQNFTKTRWFLVLRVTAPSNGLNKLLHVCNRVVQEHGQPPLYINAVDSKALARNLEVTTSSRTAALGEMPVEWNGMQDVSSSFHISIAWTLEPPSKDLRDATSFVSMNQFEDVKRIVLRVKEIKAKIGNVVTSVPLQKKMAEGKGPLGL